MGDVAVLLDDGLLIQPVLLVFPNPLLLLALTVLLTFVNLVPELPSGVISGSFS